MALILAWLRGTWIGKAAVWLVVAAAAVLLIRRDATRDMSKEIEDADREKADREKADRIRDRVDAARRGGGLHDDTRGYRD
jgi:hypothetical protein